MMIVSLWLHGKPSWALPLEGKSRIDPFLLRDYADDLRDHLYSIASLITKLQNNGWHLIETYGQLYALEYYKKGITRETLEKEMKEMEVDLNTICVEEVQEEFNVIGGGFNGKFME